MTVRERLREALDGCPVVAILRGVRPDEVVAVGQALLEAGIRIVEVPLNSPEPFKSIERLADALGNRVVVGAGTVLTEHDVDRVAAAGGVIAVAPNFNAAVVVRALDHGIEPVPGIYTPGELFAATSAGATLLKLFPAVSAMPAHLAAMTAVLPDGVDVLAVGGVGAENAAAWFAAGAVGLGCGSNIYRPGDAAEAVHAQAAAIVAAIAGIR